MRFGNDKLVWVMKNAYILFKEKQTEELFFDLSLLFSDEAC